MEARVPMSVGLSFALHAGAAVLWMQAHHRDANAQMRMISGVDLMISRRIGPTNIPQHRIRPKPMSTMDLLKLALPSVPKVSGPLDTKSLELKRDKLIEVAEKLDERQRKEQAKLEPLDLKKAHKSSAQLDAGLAKAERRSAALADMPKLEEVGMRRAPKKTLELAALAEERRREDALMPQQDLAALAGARLRAVDTAAPMLDEAAPAERPKGKLSKLADMLTSEEQPLPMAERAPMETPHRRMSALAPSLAPKREAADQLQEKKKPMEIEGPLASRKIVYYEVPAFPDWAQAQQILEMEVRVRFFVSAAGDVTADMRVEQSSGYPRLDRLSMETLRKWRFEPLSGVGRQWGIITFRFVLE